MLWGVGIITLIRISKRLGKNVYFGSFVATLADLATLARVKRVHVIDRPQVVGGRYYNFNSYLEAFEQKSLFSKFCGNPGRPGNPGEGKNGFM